MKLLIIILFISVSAYSQNKVCVERHILERVANKLDSFEIAKKIQVECKNFVDSSLMVISTQHNLIQNLDLIIENHKKQIGNLKDAEVQYTEILKVNDEYMKVLKKDKKKLKTKYTLSLVGGGVLTIGLTTALLISLL